MIYNILQNCKLKIEILDRFGKIRYKLREDVREKVDSLKDVVVVVRFQHSRCLSVSVQVQLITGLRIYSSSSSSSS